MSPFKLLRKLSQLVLALVHAVSSSLSRAFRFHTSVSLASVKLI